MDLKKLPTHPVSIIASIALGVACGVYAPELARSLKFIGDIYIDLLKMVILPFLVSAVILSINRLAHNPQASRYVARIVVSLLAGMALAGAVGLVYMKLFQPGGQMDQATMQSFGRLVQADISGVETSIHLLSPSAVDKQEGMLIKLVSRMIPSNIFGALALGDTLKTLFFALLFGFAVTKSPPSSTVGFVAGCDVVFRACQKLTSWLMVLLPLASFSLAADQIANTGFEPFKVMLHFIVAFGAVTLILLAVCIAIIWRQSGRGLAYSVASQEGPFFLAVATRNSAACMPAMLIAMVDKLGFNKAITELLVPLGTALFRVGPVLYYCMATVFIAQLYGRDLAAADLPADTGGLADCRVFVHRHERHRHHFANHHRLLASGLAFRGGVRIVCRGGAHLRYLAHHAAGHFHQCTGRADHSVGRGRCRRAGRARCRSLMDTQQQALLGILGGMGPLATVDFLGKLTRLTPANVRPGAFALGHLQPARHPGPQHGHPVWRPRPRRPT